MPKEKFTLILDSSQIALFLECPTMWYYSNFKQLIPAGVPTESDAMNAGTYGHKLLDIAYRHQHLSLNDRIDLAFSYDPDNDICECGCNKEFHKELPALGGLVECGRCKKCLGGFKAKPFSLPQEARFAVRNRLRDYFLYYQNNDFLVPSPQHVEVGFSENIYEDDENLFVLEGRIDLLASLQGLDMVVDHKFQLREHDLYDKSIQFKNYAMASKRTTLMINYIRLHKAVGKSTLVRKPVSFTGIELRAWKQRLVGIYFKVKQSIQANETFEQNWASCSGRYGYPCYFTSLCEEVDNNMRKAKINQLYKIKPVEWRPW